MISIRIARTSRVQVDGFTGASFNDNGLPPGDTIEYQLVVVIRLSEGHRIDGHVMFDRVLFDGRPNVLQFRGTPMGPERIGPN